MLNILINGACGKMGRMIAEVASQSADVCVVAGVDRFAAGATASYPLYETLSQVSTAVDVVIDFSRPDALEDILSFCRERKVACVLATTAYSPEQEQKVREASLEIPVFRTANMSLGINVMLGLLTEATMTLDGFDIEIVERHHKTKVDCPSGTALLLADTINEAAKGQKDYVYGRHTKTERRDSRELGIHAVRGGTLAGDHDVMFIGENEVLEIRHSAQSRAIFAQGALKAASYIVKKEPGQYNMRDLLLEKAAVTRLYTDEEEAMISLSLPFDGKSVADLFSSLAASNINIDMISQCAPKQSGIDVSFTLPKSKAEQARQILQQQAKQIEVKNPVAKLTVEGAGMERQSGVAARVFTVLAKAGVLAHLITTSETRIAVCMDVPDLPKAQEAIKQYFDI